jgi:hypothetical protein
MKVLAVIADDLVERISADRTANPSTPYPSDLVAEMVSLIGSAVAQAEVDRGEWPELQSIWGVSAVMDPSTPKSIIGVEQPSYAEIAKVSRWQCLVGRGHAWRAVYGDSDLPDSVVCTWCGRAGNVQPAADWPDLGD